MRIISLEAFNTRNRVKINKIDFHPFTLLVGASGVGKTQILDALTKLKKISNGRKVKVSGFEWELKFEEAEVQYSWSGKFSEIEQELEEDRENPFVDMFKPINGEDELKPKVIFEKFYINDDLVVSRDGEDIFFNGEEIVKLDPYESALNLLKQYPEIAKARKALSKINILSQRAFDPRFFGFLRRQKEVDVEITDFDALRNIEIPFQSKLYFCQEHFADRFAEIVDSYCEIFPYVEDVKILMHRPEPGSVSIVGYTISIKEKGVDNWIHQHSLSTGMLKSFMQIAYLNLCSDGTVFLIDEFENGFGVNCINDITEVLINSNGAVQFIITSHHPYIINNVPLDNWKIISRKASEISAYDPEYFNLKESNHEAFTKLINLDIYYYGAGIE